MIIRIFFPIAFLAASVATPVHPATSEPPPREITMGECVETALRNNLDVAISREDREAARFGVTAEEASFLPRFSGEFSASRSIVPSGSSLTGTLAVDQRILRFDVAATELLPTGTTLSLAFENQRQEISSAVSLLTPEYATGLTLSASHPLLKRSGREVTLAPLTMAKAGAAASDADFLVKAFDVAAAARIAFLRFYSATSEVEVKQTELDLAGKLLARTATLVEAGSAAPMDRLPSEAAVASRREELLRAEAAARNAEDDLKSVLGIRADGRWEERLVPVLEVTGPLPPGDDDTFEEALSRRPEVSALSARVRRAELQEIVSKSDARPEVTLTATAGLSGLAGKPNPDPLFPGAEGAFEGDYGDSLDELFSGRYTSWFVGLSTEIPWRLQRERAEWARSRTALSKLRLQEETLRVTILSEVRKARRELESAIARIAAAAAAVTAAEGKLEAEEKKLALGATTTVQVLEFQQDYAEARLVEVRARTDAHAAQTRLWRAVGTILEKEGISVR